jgi:hypothetical protein
MFFVVVTIKVNRYYMFTPNKTNDVKKKIIFVTLVLGYVSYVTAANFKCDIF